MEKNAKEKRLRKEKKLDKICEKRNLLYLWLVITRENFYFKLILQDIRMSSGSWMRYIVGVLLSLDVIRIAFTTRQIETSTILLAVIFLGLALLYVVKRV